MENLNLIEDGAFFYHKQQTDIASSPESKHVTYSCSSLPKLQLKKFDSDPLQLFIKPICL